MTSQSVVPSDGKGTECSLQVIDIVNTRIASRSTISSENSKRIRTVRANCFLTCVRLWDATQTATELSDWVSKRSLEVAGRPWNLIWNKSSAKSCQYWMRLIAIWIHAQFYNLGITLITLSCRMPKHSEYWGAPLIIPLPQGHKVAKAIYRLPWLGQSMGSTRLPHPSNSSLE